MTRTYSNPNAPPQPARQYNELLPGHCDHCGKRNNSLKPIQAGVHAGPTTICPTCMKALRPKVIKIVWTAAQPSPQPTLI